MQELLLTAVVGAPGRDAAPVIVVEAFTIRNCAEGIERHLHGAVTDRVKAHLELGCGTLLRHRIQLCLVITWNAAVAGVVAVGRVERGGARAERAVHKALQHAGVQHAIVGGMMGAMFFQRLDRIEEGQPLGDTDRQVIFALKLLHRQEVVPLGEVLHAGDSVDRGIRHRQ